MLPPSIASAFAHADQAVPPLAAVLDAVAVVADLELEALAVADPDADVLGVRRA